MGDSKALRVKGIVIEALRARHLNRKASAWPYIDRIAGALGVSEANIWTAGQNLKEPLPKKAEGENEA